MLLRRQEANLVSIVMLMRIRSNDLFAHRKGFQSSPSQFFSDVAGIDLYGLHDLFLALLISLCPNMSRMNQTLVWGSQTAYVLKVYKPKKWGLQGNVRQK